MLVIGDKEVEAKTVSVRSREEGDKGAMELGELIALCTDLNKNKTC